MSTEVHWHSCLLETRLLLIHHSTSSQWCFFSIIWHKNTLVNIEQFHLCCSVLTTTSDTAGRSAWNAALHQSILARIKTHASICTKSFDNRVYSKNICTLINTHQNVQNEKFITRPTISHVTATRLSFFCM